MKEDNLLGKWDVRHVYYMTYAEILTDGDKPSELVASNLNFKEACEMVNKLGSGYYTCPHMLASKAKV